MKRFFTKKISIALLLAAAAFASACKSDESTTEEAKYLTGSLSVSMPLYVVYGQKCLMRPLGVYHPEVTIRPDGTIPDSLSYYFVNPFTKDTVKTKTVPPDAVTKDPAAELEISKDTLGIFYVNWTAKSEGYYSRSTTAVFNIVDSLKTLTGFKSYSSDGSVKTPENVYPTAKIGSLEWMRVNLCDRIPGGSPWYGCDVMTKILGRYYTWTEAMKACPDGWRIPSAEEWDKICIDGKTRDAFYDVKFNGTSMWEYYPKVGDPTDSLHLSIIPAGYILLSGKSEKYRGLNTTAVFWTSDEKPDDSEMGVAKTFVDSSPNMTESYFAKDEVKLSVRCVKK